MSEVGYYVNPRRPTYRNCAASVVARRFVSNPGHTRLDNYLLPPSLLEGCTPNAQVQDRQKDYSEDVGYLTIKPLEA
jgi:hypothetical protein